MSLRLLHSCSMGSGAGRKRDGEMAHVVGCDPRPRVKTRADLFLCGHRNFSRTRRERAPRVAARPDVVKELQFFLSLPEDAMKPAAEPYASRPKRNSSLTKGRTPGMRMIGLPLLREDAPLKRNSGCVNIRRPRANGTAVPRKTKGAQPAGCAPFCTGKWIAYLEPVCSPCFSSSAAWAAASRAVSRRKGEQET
jgi:hypothetical protein